MLQSTYIAKETFETAQQVRTSRQRESREHTHHSANRLSSLMRLNSRVELWIYLAVPRVIEI